MDHQEIPTGMDPELLENLMRGTPPAVAPQPPPAQQPVRPNPPNVPAVAPAAPQVPAAIPEQPEDAGIDLGSFSPARQEDFAYRFRTGDHFFHISETSEAKQKPPTEERIPISWLAAEHHASRIAAHSRGLHKVRSHAIHLQQCLQSGQIPEDLLRAKEQDADFCRLPHADRMKGFIELAEAKLKTFAEQVAKRRDNLQTAYTDMVDDILTFQSVNRGPAIEEQQRAFFYQDPGFIEWLKTVVAAKQLTMLKAELRDYVAKKDAKRKAAAERAANAREAPDVHVPDAPPAPPQPNAPVAPAEAQVPAAGAGPSLSDTDMQNLIARLVPQLQRLPEAAPQRPEAPGGQPHRQRRRTAQRPRRNSRRPNQEGGSRQTQAQPRQTNTASTNNSRQQAQRGRQGSNTRGNGPQPRARGNGNTNPNPNRNRNQSRNAQPNRNQSNPNPQAQPQRNRQSSTRRNGRQRYFQ